jgi:hypothetical protein
MILASLSAFLFFALEAATNMFPKVVFLCLQGDQAEMTDVSGRRENKGYRS